MKFYALRLIYGEELYTKLKDFAKENNIKSGVIVSSVGSLTKLTIRDATGERIQTFEENFEIISLNGTLSKDRIHLHISVSDKDTKVFGGHLKEGTIINTTCELVILDLEEIEFKSEFDKKTGYNELKIVDNL